MSIIAAYEGSNGSVIMCADSQETVGSYAKRRVEKIVQNQKGEFSIHIGAAGSGHYADMLTFDLRYSIADNFPKYDPEKIIPFIQDKLSTFYKTHDLPRGQDAAPLELLIVLQPDAGLGYPLIIHTLETAVNIVHGFKCIGIGGFLADYILDHVLEHQGEKEHLIAVAAYMLKEVRENIEHCGKDSTIWFFGGNDGVREKVWHIYVEYLERLTHDLNANLKDVFTYITDVHGIWEGQFNTILKEIERTRFGFNDAYKTDREEKEERTDNGADEAGVG